MKYMVIGFNTRKGEIVFLSIEYCTDDELAALTICNDLNREAEKCVRFTVYQEYEA